MRFKAAPGRLSSDKRSETGYRGGKTSGQAGRAERRRWGIAEKSAADQAKRAGEHRREKRVWLALEERGTAEKSVSGQVRWPWHRAEKCGQAGRAWHRGEKRGRPGQMAMALRQKNAAANKIPLCENRCATGATLSV